MNDKPDWMTTETLWHSALDAVPNPIFVVDEDVRLMTFNPAATALLGVDPGSAILRRGGDAMLCVHHADTDAGCGHGPSCGDCVIRRSVTQAFRGQKVVRERAAVNLVRGQNVCPAELLVTAAPFVHEDRALVLLVLEDITELSTLRRLLPMCANCKKVRDDDNYWQSVEKFFSSNLPVDFSHGICPDCTRKLYPEVYHEVETALLSRAAAAQPGAAKPGPPLASTA